VIYSQPQFLGLQGSSSSSEPCKHEGGSIAAPTASARRVLICLTMDIFGYDSERTYRTTVILSSALCSFIIMFMDMLPWTLQAVLALAAFAALLGSWKRGQVRRQGHDKRLARSLSIAIHEERI
jgi:hypothetical protein